MTNLLRIGFLFCCLGSTLLLSAQQSCYEQYLREHNMPLPADNVIENDNSYDELKKEVIARQLMRGEAAASSMATGRAAITFNPAAVTTNTVSQEGLLFSDDRITNYRAAGNKLGVLLLGGDILNNLQDNHGLYIPGHTFSIKTGWKPTHGIEDIIQYFQQGL